MKLYKHQQQLVDLAPDRHALIHETGTGKSLTAMELARIKLMPALFICPKGLKKKWELDLASSGLTGYRLLSKEEFKKLWNELPPYLTVVVDECFVAGTKILTETGYKNIEDIREGDTVANATGYGVVTKTFVQKSYNLFQVNISNGKTITVTGNHPFLTENKGWVKAQDLVSSDLLVRWDMLYLDNEKNKTPERFLRYVREADRTWTASRGTFRTLQKILRWNLQKDTRSPNRGYDACSTKEAREEVCKRFINSDDEKQSDAQYGNETKDECNIEKSRTQSESSRWKWSSYAYTTKNFVSRFRTWLVCRTCRHNETEGDGIPNMLQGGYCESNKNDSYRSRRAFSLFNFSENKGQKEGNIFEKIRVESVTFQERGSDGQSKEGTSVYNLTVDGHPSYVVEGVIVHNCHHFFGTKSALMKSLRGYFMKWNTPYRYFLTATPYRSSPWDIYIMSNLLGRPMNWFLFKTKFFFEIKMGTRTIPKAREGMEGEIADIVRTLGSTVRLADCVDLPEQTFETEYFELTPSQKKAWKEVEKEDALAVTKFARYHQICGGTLKGEKGYTEDQEFDSYKIDRVVELVQENTRMILVCKYRHEMEILSKKLGQYLHVEQIHGGIDNRHSILQSLRDKPRYCLIVNAACSEGWELPECPLMVFYSYSFALINYVQMLGRIQRINNIKKNVYLSLIVKDTIDEAIFQSITIEKMDFQIELYKN